MNKIHKISGKPLSGIKKMETINSETLQAKSLVAANFRAGLEKELIGLYEKIESSLLPNENKFIQFVGCSRGEGTSTVASEFAKIVATRLGKSVLLLNADWPSSNAYPGIQAQPEYSLYEVWQGKRNLDDALSRADGSNLYVANLPRQEICSLQKSQLPAFEDLWRSLRERFHMVLIDSPPSMETPGAPILARKVDGVILIVEANKTRWPVIENLKDRILKNGGNIMGVVMSKRKYYIPDAVYRRLK